ncbi:MAG: hypothetical protein HYV33_01640 [Candidatus Kerfeldbacteria bacterium]|nr:hypothetical protein [Candidatus Kerfeldbacteria bacterium]
MAQALTPAQAKQRIKRIRQIYAEFKKEIDELKRQQHTMINQALTKIDQANIESILEDLHRKHG